MAIPSELATRAGRYISQPTGYRAFVSAPLPPQPEELITFRVSVLSQLLARMVDGSVSQELGLSSRQWRSEFLGI
jgi:hypothetical protein